jgi:molybdopterin-guanine dinucleotide biosynthesis protein A
MTASIPAVILAGGRSVRLGGGDKCLLPLRGATLLSYVIAALSPQAGEILINSNSDRELFADTGLPVHADAVLGQFGPLSGILTAMVLAQGRGASRVLTVPCDTPLLPPDLMARLRAAERTDRPVIAARGGALHPTIGLWPTALAARLRGDLDQGVRQVRGWLDQVSCTIVEFPDTGIDPFSNINTPEDIVYCFEI